MTHLSSAARRPVVLNRIGMGYTLSSCASCRGWFRNAGSRRSRLATEAPAERESPR